MSAKCQERTLRSDTQCGRGHPSVAPPNALSFFVLVPSWLVSLVTSYSVGPDVDHADSRQQRSRLSLDYQRGPRHPLR